MASLRRQGSEHGQGRLDHGRGDAVHGDEVGDEGGVREIHLEAGGVKEEEADLWGRGRGMFMHVC